MGRIKETLKKAQFLYIPYRKYYADKRDRAKKIKLLHTYGYEYLNEITCVFQNSNIQCFCVYGSLLGLIREGAFIEYDDDIDMAIIDYNGFSWKYVEDIMRLIGYRKCREFELDGKYTEQTYEKNGLTIDVFRFFVENESLFAVGYRRIEGKKYSSYTQMSAYKCVYPMIRKFEEKVIHGCNILVPTNLDEIMVSWYGESWKIPDKGYKRKEFNYFSSNGIVHYINS